MATVHEFKMEMTCEGCSGAAKRVLGKLSEVSEVECSIPDQKVTVTSTLPSDQLLEQLKKAGKPVSYIGVKQ